MSGWRDPWWIPGWTSQHPTWTWDPPEPPTPFPAHIEQVHIQAVFMWGSAADTYRASLLVRANSPLVDSTTGIVVLPQTARIPIREGKADFTLPASDGPTLAQPITYSVWEVMPGGRQYTISVPSGRGGAVQNLRALKSGEPYQHIPVPRLNSSNWKWMYG